MVRDPDYEDETAQAETEEEETPTPAPKKKTGLMKKKTPSQQQPEMPQIMRVPVFESQAQQVFYDELLAIRQEIGMLRSEIAEIKAMAQE